MKAQTRYAIRVIWKDGSCTDPIPGITNYQFAMRKAKDMLSNSPALVESVFVVTYKPSSVRKVAA